MPDMVTIERDYLIRLVAENQMLRDAYANQLQTGALRLAAISEMLELQTESLVVMRTLLADSGNPLAVQALYAIAGIQYDMHDVVRNTP